MKSTMLKGFSQFLTTAFGIFMIGALPYLFFDNMEAAKINIKLLRTGVIKDTSFLGGFDGGFYIGSYFSHIVASVTEIIHPANLTYFSLAGPVPIFPKILDAYLYSMEIFIVGLCGGLFAALMLTYFLMLAGRRVRKTAQSFLYFIESLPDIFVILLLQTLIVWIYDSTGILFFDIISVEFNRAYGLPMLCLAVIPMVFLSKYLMVVFEEEEAQRYVELARGMGLAKSTIILVNMFRNVLISLFLQSKTMFWVALSNLLVLEIIFGMHGLFRFIWKHAPMNPEIMTVGMLMIFIPYFILFTTGQFLLERKGAVQLDSEIV
ncbi:MAG TPA: ABC transporter permease subunit [Bacillales bacterium]|nr:ABC transporter permease subunit [Bacillales bacterium]